MKVFIKGKNQEVTLTQREFVSQGGQGSIYAKGGKAFKIFDDPAKITPESKIRELSVLKNGNIIKPDEILLDQKNSIVGYNMKYVTDTYSLCQLFTKAFKLRNNLATDTILNLVRRMQSTIKDIHSKKILIVDLNELNFLVDQSFNEVYFIDVDSYETEHFKAPALMESVRDRHVKNNHWTEGSDWFSFGIVSFQMLIGIHPFKGKHVDYSDLDSRMIHNMSVLNNTVSFPKQAVLPFDVIPNALLQWYQAIFEKGIRSAPPTDFINVIQVVTAPRVSKAGAGRLFTIKLLFEYESSESIIDYMASGNQNVTVTNKNIYVNTAKRSVYNGGFVGFTAKRNVPFTAKTVNGRLELFDLLNNKDIQCNIAAKSITCYHGRIYFVNNENLLELDFIESGPVLMPSPRIIGNVLEHATQLFSGCAIQNLLGSYYVSIFPESGKCYQLKLAELDSYKVIDAKFQHNILVVVAAKSGQYHRFIFQVGLTYGGYTVRITPDIDNESVNFVVLDGGIAVMMFGDGSLEVFHSRTTNHNVMVPTGEIDADAKLLTDGTSVYFAVDNKFYSIKKGQ
jgi:serine/threonine protein kinase